MELSRFRFEKVEIKDPSCLSVCDKFIVVGSHWGSVFIFDLVLSCLRTINSHSATVNDISINELNEWIASAADDGKINFIDMFSENVSSYAHQRPVKTISLCPSYSLASPQFVSGGLGETLYMTSKGWFAKSHIAIHSGEGPIYSCRWFREYVAWANDGGVRIYDTINSEKFAYIERSDFRPELYPCSLKWYNLDPLSPTSPANIIVAWFNTIKIGTVRDRSKEDISGGLTHKFLEITIELQLDIIITGITNYIDVDQNKIDELENKLLLLYLDIDDNATRSEIATINDSTTPAEEHTDTEIINSQGNNFPKPGLKLINMDGYEIYSEALSVIYDRHYQPKDFRLESCQDNYYILTPNTLFAGNPLTMKERVNQLVIHREYKNALNIAHKYQHDWRDILELYLKDLWSKDEFEDVSQILALYCPYDNEDPQELYKDTQVWEVWVSRFIQKDNVSTLIPWLPGDIKFSTDLNTEIFQFLVMSPALFLARARSLECNEYDTDKIISIIQGKVDIHTDLIFALFHIYDLLGLTKDAAILALQHGLPDVVSYITDHSLWPHLYSHIILLFEYQDLIHSETILSFVKSLKYEDEMDNVFEKIILARHQCELLHLLWTHKKFTRRHDLLVSLYAEYTPLFLASFLRTSHHYDLAKALHVCTNYGYVQEIIFLLLKTGDVKEALLYMINNLDAAAVLSFMKTQDEQDDTWIFFLENISTRPDYVALVLGSLWEIPHPVAFLEGIPENMPFLNLRVVLLDIFVKARIEKTIQQECDVIIRGEITDVFDRLERELKKAEPWSGEFIQEQQINANTEKQLKLHKLENSLYGRTKNI